MEHQCEECSFRGAEGAHAAGFPLGTVSDHLPQRNIPPERSLALSESRKVQMSDNKMLSVRKKNIPTVLMHLITASCDVLMRGEHTSGVRKLLLKDPHSEALTFLQQYYKAACVPDIV